MPPPPRGPGAGGPDSTQGPTVSGPGPMSRRTDTGPIQKIAQLPDAQYGENATYQDLQQSAPLDQSPGPSAGGMPSGGDANLNAAANNVVPFNSPTQRPNEPVTAGASMGPGPGTEALGLNLSQNEAQDIRSLANYLPAMEFMANQRDALPSSRMAVNIIKAGGQV